MFIDKFDRVYNLYSKPEPRVTNTTTFKLQGNCCNAFNCCL